MRPRRPLRLLPRALAFSLALLAAGACADDEAVTDAASKAQPETCDSGRTQSVIITTLAFTNKGADGITPGFDLDGIVSSGNDATSCNKLDFTDPDGTPGVDNQVAALLPDIKAIVGDAVDGLVQGAINNGELLIVLDLEHLDSLQNDACVGLTVQLAQGTPALGTDGVIEGFQTFALKAQNLQSHGQQGRIRDGLFTLGPMQLDIPLKLFSVDFVMHIHDASFRFKVSEEGYLDGYLGGGIVPDELIEGIKDGDGIQDILPLIRTILKQSADLKPDAEGTCQQVSVALAVKAAPAFTVPADAGR